MSDKDFILQMFSKRGIRVSTATWADEGTRISVDIRYNLECLNSGGDADLVDFYFDNSGEFLILEAWERKYGKE